MLLACRAFGPEVLLLWRWKPGSVVAGDDRGARIRFGQDVPHPTPRNNVDDIGDIGFDMMLPRPHDDECTGCASAPARRVDDEDIVCTVHGPNDNNVRGDDPQGRVDPEVQAADAIRE